MLIRILSLDLSMSTGYALIENGRLLDSGLLTTTLEDFNIKNYPDRQPGYPYNIVNAADEIANKVWSLVLLTDPDHIVIENTVCGRNRHTQRCLEFIHKAVLDRCYDVRGKIRYLSPSEWRKTLNLRLSDEDKAHNKRVREKKARGKITAKHLSVRRANAMFNTEFILKDNDITDAILLGIAFESRLK